MTWYAVLHLTLLLVTGQPYASIHGPFSTLASCRQFVRQFVQTYDDKASGARIRQTLCIAPGKQVIVLPGGERRSLIWTPKLHLLN